MTKRFKSAFTLIELSVVIVIISIMLSTVLVSRQLIISARINKIQEEYRAYYTAFSVFSDTYGCIPGDCTAQEVPDLLPRLPGYVAKTATTMATSVCTTPTTTNNNHTQIILNTNRIESTAKKTCAMHELQATGYIYGLRTIENPTNISISNNMVGFGIPYTSFNKMGSWNFRTPLPINGNEGTFPYPLSTDATIPSGVLAQWRGKVALVLQSSKQDAASVSIIDGTPHNDIYNNDNVSDKSTLAQPFLSAYVARKLDLKFDDGLPYSGFVVSGKPMVSAFSDLARNDLCNDNAASEHIATNILPTVEYLNSTDAAHGCLVAFLINTM